MIFLSIILGIVMICGGFACLANPGAAFLSTGYLMAILLFVFGIVGIIYVIAKKYPTIHLLGDIPALIIGAVALFKPGTTLVFDMVIAYLMAIWYVIHSVVTIYLSIKYRKENSRWVLTLILGIVALVIGIYSLFQPMVSFLAIGILIGIYLIEAGLNMILLPTVVGTIAGAAAGMDAGATMGAAAGTLFGAAAQKMADEEEAAENIIADVEAEAEDVTQTAEEVVEEVEKESDEL